MHFVRELRAELGGVVATTIDLCQSIASRGHRVIVATCDDADAPAGWRERREGVPEVVVVPTSTMTRQLVSRRGLDELAELARQADVAHLHTPWEMCNLQLSRVLRAANVPFVISAHGMLDDYCMNQKGVKKRAYLALAGRRLFERATTVHFTAQAERDQALAYVPGADRAVVQSCSVDLGPYGELPGPELALRVFPVIRPEAFKILFLSRIHPKKGVELLIRAAAMLNTSASPIQLLIGGPGEPNYIDSLKNLAEKTGVASATHFLGMVQGGEKRSLYQAADVFVLPTYQENFGLVLAEAMACGTPVITTRGADIWQELQSGGARIADHTPESIAAAITDVMRDRVDAQRAGRQGRDFIFRWLDLEEVSAGYEQMYHDAIARGLPPFVSKALERECESHVA
jgi:glycosyltransferase involved in cell wall biosynthesis